jgi:hypothetical protein
LVSSWKTSIAAAVFALLTLPAVAAPAGFAEGVRAYNARQYSQALGYFRQALRTAPSDPQIHYYMGLSYQGLNQMTLAKQEYSYVASLRCPLSGHASAALSNLSKYSTSYAGPGYTGSAGTARSTTPTVASASDASAGPTQKVNGRLQLIYFYIDG